MATAARKVAVAVATVVALSARAAHGDAPTPPEPPLVAPLQPGTGFLHLRSSTSVATDGGTNLRLPPGYYLDEPTWEKLDSEFRRLQDAETRLTAENKSMRTTTQSWQPGWKALTITLVVGFAGGVYLRGKY